MTPDDKKPINYDPAEREQAIRYVAGDKLIQPNEKGEYIIRYSFEIDDYHIPDGGYLNMNEDQRTFHLQKDYGYENNLTGLEFTARKNQEASFNQISSYTNLNFEEFKAYQEDHRVYKIGSQILSEYSENPPEHLKDEYGYINYDEARAEAEALAEEQRVIPDVVMATFKTYNNLDYKNDKFVVAPDDTTAGIASFPGAGEQRSILYKTSISDPPFTFNDELAYYNEARAFQNVLHETGHFIGLSHTHHSGYSGALPFGMHGTTELKKGSELDNTTNSVMSYTKDTETGLPRTYAMWDIAAMQHMYGANYSTNSGSTVHAVTGKDLKNDLDNSPRSIWDGGGKDDWLDAKDAVASAEINLWESIHTPSVINQEEVFLAYGSNIENARGSKYADNITGNNLNNRLEGGAGDDTLRGDGGNDILVGGDGDNIFDLRTKNGASVGHDIVEDFSTHQLDLLGGDEDRIIVDNRVETISVYEHEGNHVFVFYDKNGAQIEDMSLTLTGLDGNTWDIDVIKYTKDAEGKETPYQFDENDKITYHQGSPEDHTILKDALANLGAYYKGEVGTLEAPSNTPDNGQDQQRNR